MAGQGLSKSVYMSNGVVALQLQLVVLHKEEPWNKPKACAVPPSGVTVGSVWDTWFECSGPGKSPDLSRFI